LTFLELFEKRSWIDSERARAAWGLLIEVRKMLAKLISRLEAGADDSANEAPET
jgi:hypothetical protein